MSSVMFYTLSVASMLCALTPAVLFVMNLRRYEAPALLIPDSDERRPGVSVLIPARDEAHGIEAAVSSVFTSLGVQFEVVVMDDHSTDGTGAIVAAMAARDARVRLELAPKLPPGWNGKQHTCWSLAHVAKYDTFCFVDADVRLEPDALVRMVAFMELTQAPLVSGFPRQETGTFLEWLLLPLIHFVLLGFLPLDRMRRSTDPAFAAGCGQFMMVDRGSYFAAGGHAAIKATMHDGLLLPKLFRQHGMKTDLADITDYARCRMYRNAGQVWQGLAKNATEGIAAPVRILPISLVLVLGQIVPYLLAISLLAGHEVKPEVAVYIAVAVAAAWFPRVLAARAFRQDWRGALLHPLGIAVLLAIQWYSLTRKLTGGAVSWKSRAYAGE
ncbi:glycosyltransferase family 2 protein [Granulicella aggregans]|jgi:glycosyltransferase involved in cell wall biosynthesis|uniref:glycosyltransferase family 2 protein n=1 Tax=Granulicella aggregans TaxID=474949 RepID=UPI0021E0EEAF|nr:glycosyltransferase family 2 protein [Granulicella aggregans]